MKWKLITLGFSLLLVCIFGMWSPEEKLKKVDEVTIKIQLEIKNTSLDVIENAEFLFWGPAYKTSHQSLKHLSVSQKHRLERDEHGNQAIVIQFDEIAPLEQHVVSIVARLDYFELPSELDLKILESYSYPLLYKGNDLREIIVEEITGKSFPVSVSKWLQSNISYAGYIKKDLGAEYAFKKRKGDCTEFMYLFNSFMEIEKYKTRGLGGFVISGNSYLVDAKEYHNWSEYLDNDVWMIADPLNNFSYDSSKDKYIAFRIINTDKNSLSNSHRFMAFDKRLQVKML